MKATGGTPHSIASINTRGKPSNLDGKTNIEEFKYSSSIWTNPVEIESEQFLNCIGITETTLDLNEITGILKNIEHLCESSHKEHKMGIVKLDLDLLSYGDVKYHTDDWNRPYIHNLLKEFNINF